jgi:hypothetical protein
MFAEAREIERNVTPMIAARLFSGDHPAVIGAGPTPGHDNVLGLGNDNLLSGLHGDLSSSLDRPELQGALHSPVNCFCPAWCTFFAFSFQNSGKSLAHTEFF